MFENVGNYKVIKLGFQLVEILSPYWNLFKEIKKESLINEMCFEDAEFQNSLNSIQKDYADFIKNKESIEDENVVQGRFDSFFNQSFQLLCTYVIKNLFNKDLFKKVLKNDVLAIFKFDEDFLLFTDARTDDHIKRGLTKFLRETNPVLIALRIIVPSTQDHQLRGMINTSIYENYVKDSLAVAESRNLFSPIYHHRSIRIVEENVERIEINEDAFWINNSLFQTNHGLHIEEKLSVCYIKKVLGVEDSFGGYEMIELSNNYFLPLIQNFKQVYDANVAAHWDDFKHGAYNKKYNAKNEPINQVNHKNKISDQFFSEAHKESVTNKLSYLKDNLFLYPNDIKQSDGIEEFFQDIAIIEDLDELQNYQFFSSNLDKTLDCVFLGIHKKDKAGSKSFKLIHNFINRGSNLEDFNGSMQINRKKKQLVKILRPELTFYFLQNFYENFVEDCMQKIQNDNLPVDFVINQHVTKDNRDNEIDMISFNQKNIFFIELKTILSIQCITAYQDKCNQWLKDNEEISSFMKFVIIGCYGNEELNICKGKESELYNTKREGLKNPAYDFTVPLENGHILRCFTESSFDKLKLKLIEVLELQ